MNRRSFLKSVGLAVAAFQAWRPSVIPVIAESPVTPKTVGTATLDQRWVLRVQERQRLIDIYRRVGGLERFSASRICCPIHRTTGTAIEFP